MTTKWESEACFQLVWLLGGPRNPSGGSLNDNSLDSARGRDLAPCKIVATHDYTNYGIRS